MGLRTLESAESQGYGLCIVTIGHISFHTQGEETADGLADPAFFQKVMTLVNPGRSGNRKAPETYRLTEVKLRHWSSPAGSWVIAFSDLFNSQAMGFGPKGAFPGWGGNRADFPEWYKLQTSSVAFTQR